jgi:DNA-binding PadR family transcriptional regulator
MGESSFGKVRSRPYTSGTDLVSSELTTFSHVVLVLVGENGAGAHDLRRMAERGGRLYWAAAPSQYYAEPKRLARLGFLEAHVEPGRTNPRTRYTLTDRGRAALREWLATPAPFPRIQHEPAVRLLAADLVEPDVVRRSLGGLRAQLDEQERLLDEGEAVARSLPHRERWLTINHRLSRRLIEAHRAWLDELDAELGG